MAHGRDKRVVLMVQDESKMPFDLREIRYLQYDSTDLTSLRLKLTEYVKNCISTIPADWNRSFRPPDWKGGYVKITSLEAPSSVQLEQPFEISVKARNNGSDANQGYFSVSFPDGVDNLHMESSTEHRIGLKGDSWKNGNLVLSYPIAEGYKWGEVEPVWLAGKEYSISVRGYPKRKGLLWYYVNASCYDKALNDRRRDPKRRILDRDQRDEDVYCGTIDVIEGR